MCNTVSMCTGHALLRFLPRVPLFVPPKISQGKFPTSTRPLRRPAWSFSTPANGETIGTVVLRLRLRLWLRLRLAAVLRSPLCAWEQGGGCMHLVHDAHLATSCRNRTDSWQSAFRANSSKAEARCGVSPRRSHVHTCTSEETEGGSGDGYRG